MANICECHNGIILCEKPECTSVKCDCEWVPDNWVPNFFPEDNEAIEPTTDTENPYVCEACQ